MDVTRNEELVLVVSAAEVLQGLKKQFPEEFLLSRMASGGLKMRVNDQGTKLVLTSMERTTSWADLKEHRPGVSPNDAGS